MEQEFTVSSTGFVNYFPSPERTARQVEAAYKQNGEDIIIIDGDDDWNADSIFHVYADLKEAGIAAIDSFHAGISGMSKSGMVIKKSDFPKFLEWLSQHAPHYPKSQGSVRSSLKWYDRDAEQWVVLLQKEF